MTTPTHASTESRTRRSPTAQQPRDASGPRAQADGGPDDTAEVSPGDLSRARELADRILALGDPWAARFIAYIASRVELQSGVDGDPQEAELDDWLLNVRVGVLARSLLEAWVRGSTCSEPQDHGIEAVGRTAVFNPPLTGP